MSIEPTKEGKIADKSSINERDFEDASNIDQNVLTPKIIQQIKEDNKSSKFKGFLKTSRVLTGLTQNFHFVRFYSIFIFAV